ncbi:DUF3152 domain-containing protein [Propioniciclava soli]|uniref:DUF3152 domain-containing protein n=1 Tax=Propioniciclava soli TaxID=2775081 RepID=A0ABZ3C615_9ACTN|nr:DUF3152 domain-containing protein [Propioniciclava soli]
MSTAHPAPRRGTTLWRLVLVLLLLAVAAGVVWAYVVPRPPSPDAVPVETTPAPTPTPTPAIPEIARQQVWTSDTPSSGEYRLNTVALEPAVAHERVVDYVVKVESTVPDIDPDEAAREIQAVFDDERGWAGYGRTSFRAVTHESAAAMILYLAAPDSAQELCAPLDIARTWNCRNGANVVLNTDRWLYMTPTYDDLAAYRAYLVNHEVGHYLGLGHVECPAAGSVAPVMMQQSIDLGGCLPNAWPREAD